MASRSFIGTSGWTYPAWGRGVFYPANIKPAEWLPYYAGRFNSVEVNSTFYRLPEKPVFETWCRQTPGAFRFAVKASRFITHRKKLVDPDEHVALLLDHAKELGEKMSVVLFQLPPFWKFNRERLEGLCRYLARQTLMPGVRAALEVRHVSWLCQECFDLLHRHNLALVFSDWPSLRVDAPVTADFVYLRRHGPAELYASSYSPTMLRRDALRMRSWLAEGIDVYAYFNNDGSGYAVQNAGALEEYAS